MERRHALKILGALAFTACAPSEAQGTPQAQSTDRKPATPTLVREKTLDERAKEGALNTWKELLTSTKEKTADSAGTPIIRRLKMEIINPDVWNTLSQQALTGKSTTPLRVRWIATETIDDRNNGMAGTKWIGEAEFNNIAVEAVSGKLSDADKANVIQWSGIAGLSFLSKSRSVLSNTPGWVKNKEGFQRWVSDPNPDQALPEFSSFQNDTWFTELQLKNGQWQRNPKLSSDANPLKDFELPTSVLRFCDRSACKTVDAPIR